MNIRHAEPGDLPRIVAIYNTAIPGRMATADLEPATVESRRAWFDAHDPKRRPLWVAMHESQVVAWLSLRDFYGRPAYHATVELALYVEPAHQRRGIGAALLEHAIASAPACGVRTLLGFVFAHNAPSITLLGRHGFERWGQLPRVAELDGIERDLLIVGKRV